jgi:DNA-binding MarR family transcriptional regulator
MSYSVKTLAARDYERLCVCHAVRRVARRVSKRYEDALRPVGLKAGQFTILAALERPEPVPLGQLAADLGMDRTTLSKDLRPLERRGLVRSGRAETDARVRALQLSGDGRALLARAHPLWSAAQADSHARLAGEAWADVRASLDRLAD